MKKLFTILTIVLISLSAQAITLNEWNALDAYSKYEVLYNEEVDYTELSEKEIAQITDMDLLEVIAKASKYVLNNVSDEGIYNDVDNMETIVTIGGPQLFGLNIYKLEGQVIGYQLSFYQEGGDTIDGSAPSKKHFDTEEEATAAGIDIGADVNWQVHSMVEIIDGMVLELNLDIWNEGGWSWSGW